MVFVNLLAMFTAFEIEDAKTHRSTAFVFYLFGVTTNFDLVVKSEICNRGLQIFIQ